MNVDELVKALESWTFQQYRSASSQGQSMSSLAGAVKELVDAPRMWWCGRYDIYSAEQSCNLDGLTAALHPDCGWVRVVKEVN